MKQCNILLKRRGGGRNGNGGQHHNGGVSQREPRPHAGRAFTLLHHLTRDGINGRDVVGIHRMTESITPGQQAGGHQRRTAAEGLPCPAPCQKISHYQSQQQKRRAGFIA